MCFTDDDYDGNFYYCFGGEKKTSACARENMQSGNFRDSSAFSLMDLNYGKMLWLGERFGFLLVSHAHRTSRYQIFIM